MLLKTGTTLDGIVSSLSPKWPKFCSHGDLYRALWLLFQSNSLTQALPFFNPTLSTEGSTSHNDSSKKKDPTKKKDDKKPRDLSVFVQNEHAKRMGKDFYRFLGLKESANYPDIDRVCQKLIKTYSRIKKSKRLSGDEEKKLEDLLHGVQLVYKQLLDPLTREEYNTRKRSGRAPVVESPRIIQEVSKPASPQKSQKPEYESLINSGNFQGAYNILRKLLQEDSSDIDVLCDLGWVSWNLKKDLKDAEENILLALTFEKRHIRSYRYLSEIYVQAKEFEKAKRYLGVLVKLAPRDAKAKQMLASLDQNQDQPSSKRWFRS